MIQELYNGIKGINGINMTEIINKAAEIRKLLAQNKTTREIAEELRVSLRDIGRVKQQLGIDIGALEREKRDREKEIDVLQSRITQMRQELAQSEKRNSTLLRQNNKLEAEIKRKKTEVIQIVQPIVVEDIYIPRNSEKVAGYLNTLRNDQLQYITEVITRIFSDRLASALRDQKKRIEQQTFYTLSQLRGDF
ncbi:hypothetical protein ACFLTN_01185 [Chloroflexota bacterium]